MPCSNDNQGCYKQEKKNYKKGIEDPQSYQETLILTKSTYSLNFSSEERSRRGIPERNNKIREVKIGDNTATHSGPLITFIEMIKMPHQRTISPK